MKCNTLSHGINLIEIIIDEIALEGLDGITLNALWTRLAIRLQESLPLKEAFMEQIWKICLELPDLKFYELDEPRKNLVIYDLYELEYLTTGVDKEFEQTEIYLHCPIEDAKNGNRGSCSTYYTRKDITSLVKNLNLSTVKLKYDQKFIIVASQILRERALIQDGIDPTLELPISHYCLLERIGRTRRMGEITVKKNSNVKEDARTLFYLRKNLQQNGLIRMQKYYQGNFKGTYNGLNIGTLVHLTRFYNTRKPKVIMWAEHLITYLKTKDKYAAEYNEVKDELNLDYSIKKFFKIQLLQKIFRTDVKVPYRSYYPNSVEKEWQVKNGSGKERIIKLVTLTDEKVEISDIWRTEEIEETEDPKQLDMKYQKLNKPFLNQIYSIVENKGHIGASQTELSMELGVTKLVGRTLVRNLVKSKIVSSYLDDVGRQRTTKFVSKKYHEQSTLRKKFDSEISKIKEFSESIKITEIEENVTKIQSSKDNGDKLLDQEIQTNNDLAGQENDSMLKNENNKSIELCKELQSEMKDLSKKLEDETKDLLKGNISDKNKLTDQTYALVNKIFKKYNLFKYKNRFTRLSKTPTEMLRFSIKNNKEIKSIKKSKGKALETKKTNLQKAQISKYKIIKLIDSDFYKSIETNLIIQKPECKKKSKKLPISGVLPTDNDNKQNVKQSGITLKLLKRTNLIIQSIKEHKIIEDFQKLIKFIYEEENNDKEKGDKGKIDKNSLIRLLQRMEEDNLIKYIKLVLKNKDHTKQKVTTFICDPSIDINDPLLQSAIEQAKLKFSMQETNSQNLSGSKKGACARTSSTPKEVCTIIQRIDKLGKDYGYSPKFIRIKTLHIYLYYLVYGHNKTSIQKDEFADTLKQDGLFFEELLDDNIKVYSKNIDWKMFIAPLPKHKGYPEGWALMRDMLLRIPLSIFVKVVNVNYEVPGLRDFLDHSVKRHLPVKNLPSSIRNKLYIKRTYVFKIHETVQRLCFIGLVQFGPQMLKEKDQVFIYLNKHTELLDTTSSAAGYHKVEDKPYPVSKYTFTSMESVDTYWYDVWNTCINTCLGGRSVVEGESITLEDLTRKIEMIQALKVRQPDEAPIYDTGFVPGDRKGAAGIDSAFFSHLKRNWNWVNSQNNLLKKKCLNDNFKKSNNQSMYINESKKLSQKKKLPKQCNLRIAMTAGTRFPEAPKSPPKSKKNLVNSGFPTIGISKPSKIIRKVLPRKQMRKRVKYDEIDFSALQRMDKLRVDWEQHEDNILLVCKVAMVYLCPNPRRNLVSFTAIRDILRSYSFTSYNKTSRACQRRLLYMLKQPKTINSVLLGVEEVKQDFVVNKRFGSQVNSIRNDCEDHEEHEKRMEKVFKDLVMCIAKKYYNITNMERREPIVLPKTVQEFNIFHNLKIPTKTIKTPGISKEVREINDIHTATINSVIHSSMCCGKERRSWAYQLFKVYQQYPEYLLRSAMCKIRADQMVTMKKNYMCAQKKFGNCMPMSSSQYQLSSSYYYKFQTKWPYEVFSETYNIFLSLLKNYIYRERNEITDGVELKSGIGGIIAMMHDFVSTDNMYVKTDIPEQMIMLDPKLPEKDEVYQRIAQRYQVILDNLSSYDFEHLELNEHFPKEEPNQIDSPDVIISTEIPDVRTRQTRIAMLKMREELHDLTFHDSHHAHEYFVVNSFKLNFSLIASEIEKQNLVLYQNMELPKKLLPIDIEAANTVLDYIKNHAIFPKNPISFDDLKNKTSEFYNWENVNIVCNFIKSKLEFGATLHELATNFNYQNDQLADILVLLTENRLVLRAGIVAVRYIHHKYINPWIIHSYKILRLEKESHQNLPEGSVFVLDNEDYMANKEEEEEEDSNRVTTAANLFYNQPSEYNTNINLKRHLGPSKEEPSLKKMKKNPEEKTSEFLETQMEVDDETETENQSNVKQNDESVTNDNQNVDKKINFVLASKLDEFKQYENDSDEKSTKRLRRNRTVLLKQKDIYRAAKLLDFNTAEEIKVVIKPWIRIDGVLNRRVLDRMLGAVLCYCIERPGMSLTAVQNRFTPALQPYHTRELIEILVKLDCIKTTVQKIPKATLFSKPAKVYLGGNPDLEADSNSVIVEPALQAALKFGIFLSNRSYNLDFLSSL